MAFGTMSIATISGIAIPNIRDKLVDAIITMRASVGSKYVLIVRRIISRARAGLQFIEAA